MHHDITIVFNPTEPDPVGRATPSTLGRVLLHLPGLGLYGRPDQLRAWLQAGIDALSDGTVRWDADSAHVAPLHPSVNHVRAAAEDDESITARSLCGSDRGRIDPGEITCPACLHLTEVDPKASA